jgi:hypothetical protein
VPAYLRPKRSFKADKNFAKKVRHVKKWGTRSDNDDVGDVVMVLNNMRSHTPNVFKPKKSKTRKNRRV